MMILGPDFCSSFGSQLFWRHLFPSSWSGSDLLWQGNLIYNEITRRQLNDIILKVSARDTLQNQQLINDLRLLVPCLTNDEDEGGLSSSLEILFRRGILHSCSSFSILL
jgi:hypothetical protein